MQKSEIVFFGLAGLSALYLATGPLLSFGQGANFAAEAADSDFAGIHAGCSAGGGGGCGCGGGAN